MRSISCDGKSIELDEDGYLTNLNDWSEGVAKMLATEDSLDLTDAHWEVINFLRSYYQQYQIAPMIKILVKEIKKTMGADKGNTKYLYQLFPDGPAKQACRYAGLPKPTGCV
ncbi:TusE/DsrC/DsvC family sulfur relay protein [Candidatus Magnetomonas plexicatena]|uniref:TusE/DsrC/DsvC family sulfur relay protein n=1 Tax=Candidatus Magnetomonas plexicatena TaxID=2552947 RepID=UPI001C75785E|nr:TusE/DsrC/DsvC family sulfur relay protein [Nitrospirales bacterium LBB_01]